MEDASRVERGAGWLSAWVGEEHVMMNAETGTCISLSATGGRIWELLEKPRTFEQLCSTLQEEYDAPPEVLREDALRFIEKMQAEQALTVQPA